MASFENKNEQARQRWQIVSGAFLALCLGACAANDVGEPPPEDAEAFASESEADESVAGDEPTADAGSALISAAPYNGACGSGYVKIDSVAIPGGIVYLTYNGSVGKNCVVTIRNTPGARLFMNAFVRRADGTGLDEDPGNYTTYAGPVYVYAPHTCIDWGGEINGSGVIVLDSHCG